MAENPGSTTTATLTIRPATAAQLDALIRDPARLERELGATLPDAGWPEFPEAVTFTSDVLRQRPEEADWWMYFFVDETLPAVVGSGGFKGAPVEGSVEIGYEVAPRFRGRNYATRAAELLVRRAFEAADVQVVAAHTLAQDGPSARVLAKVGFTRTATVEDPEVGAVWRWETTRSAFRERPGG